MNRLDYFIARLEANMSPMEYVRSVKENPDQYILLDVRVGPPDIKKDKIKGAVEIPLDRLEERLSELPKDKEIIAYCWDTWCTLAAKAAIILLENGYGAKEMHGGIAAWKTLGLSVSPVDGGKDSLQSCEF
ncbi:MAG TPA: rhodanese-like domain-containing protein [Bacillales bacterium]